MKRITEFEALRGLMALWVVVGHVLRETGYDSPGALPHFSFLARPGLAVDVFIMLSGFVIFNLLDQQHEDWLSFVTRRFFRLYPLYLVVLIVSAILSPLYPVYLHMLPIQGEAVRILETLAHQTNAALLPHFLVHLTMLHGLVPNSILAPSSLAIVRQAWSISVEWQFYLVAPLLFFLLRDRPWMFALAVAGVVAIHTRYWLDVGFAINQGGFFLIGIASYFVYRRLQALHLETAHIVIAGLAAIAAAAYFTRDPLPFAIWWIFLCAAVLSQQGIRNPFSLFCDSAACQTMGRISYSIYLCHVLVLSGISYSILRFAGYTSRPVFAIETLTATVAVTIAVSFVTFRLIEAPCIALGAKIRPKPKFAPSQADTPIPDSIPSTPTLLLDQASAKTFY
ncbi:MAG TPA: acyltransferase [Rhizomicrobium sp.]|nr:acyltransferase [Rhizomicrobium sp.]